MDKEALNNALELPLEDILLAHILDNGQNYVIDAFTKACEKRAEMFAQAEIERPGNFIKAKKELEGLAFMLQYIKR